MSYDIVKCPYCDKEFSQIVGRHLAQHQKTVADMKKEFPDSQLISQSVFDKQKKTSMDKYGVDNPSKNKEVKDKIKNTFLEKYGTTCSLQNKDIKEKVRETNRKKYGADHYFASEIGKEKLKQANLEKYGVEYSGSLPSVHKKVEDTNLKKYGVKNVFQTEKVKKGIKATNLEKYGAENPSQNKDIIKKKKENHVKNYIEANIDSMNSFEIKLVDPEYISVHHKHNWKCNKCGNYFEAIWNTIRSGYGKCPQCFPREYNSSIEEVEVRNFIASLGLDIIPNDRTLISPLELDIVIPSKNAAIEYCGLYWHSESQGKDINYHTNKLNACNKVGYRLITIFSDEWNLHNEIVKNRVKSILGVSSAKRIHARKCEIGFIDTKIKNEFLTKFHIQGRDSSSIKIGAYYNDDLIAIMTFSKGSIAKGNKSKEGIWELNRFCSDYNYHIPGIAGKLLSFFKNHYEWKEIFSYADRRWSDGNLYKQLGFTFTSNTKPNYWYTKDGMTKVHRFALRKRSDEPKNTTEITLRIAEGYNRIWDCGSMKFIMENSNVK